MLYWPNKHPEEVDDFGCDWSSALLNLGASAITGSTWSLESGDVTISAPTFTPTTTSIRIAGGSLGENVLLNTISTNLGQLRSKRCYILVD
jgi:hypothetical protein